MGMKVLVTGASGLLGRRVFKRLKESSSFEVTGTCFSRTDNKDLVKLDITDISLLRSFFQEHKPEAIIHCAAERRPDVVEKEPAKVHKINAEATQHLCDLAQTHKSWLIYISTDYVFDGKSAPYEESAVPNPINLYGKSKLAGEQVTLASDGESSNAILRVPILYGPIEYIGESAVTVLYDKVKDGSVSCSMDHRQRRYPTHTDTVADVVCGMLLKHQQEKFSLSGIYQLSDTRMLTKYDMAVAMAKALQLPTDNIIANTSEPSSTDVPRPYDCQLLTKRLEQASVAITHKDFDEEIKSVITNYLQAGKS